MAGIGKRVFDELYVHLSGVDLLEDGQLKVRISIATQALPHRNGVPVNVAKLNLRNDSISLLAYKDFDVDPFPELAESWTFGRDLAKGPACRLYKDSLNPPILHRKELLVPLNYPGRARWAQLTATAEALGLFDDTSSIGFKVNWERLIATKGYSLAGDEFLPLSNESYADHAGSPVADGVVRRHLTALNRTNLSAPVQLLIRHGLLPPGSTVFDYGCGRGGDLAGLAACGYETRGWDPHFAPDQILMNADVVNLGFVVNVIEDPAERVDAVQRAFGLARKVLSVGVMLYGGLSSGKPYRDGYISSRHTFQKYFTQSEFKDYLEQVLHHTAFMVAPGVAFVFPDKEVEQSFLTARFRSGGVAGRLLALGSRRERANSKQYASRMRAPSTPSPSRADAEFIRTRPHLDRLWATSLELGRLPERDEIENPDDLVSLLGSLDKAFRMIDRHYDQSLIAVAARTRSNDVAVYMASQQFSKRPTYRQLEPRLRRDIRCFFGDYRSALAAGSELLRDAADTNKLLAACQSASSEGMGFMSGDVSLQIHLSLVDRLPAVLRVYVACGLILWDAASEVQLIKIHINTGKLTLMEFDDFDSSPIPRLRRRIKVNLRKSDYAVFEYGTSEHPKPPLYGKSRYLHEEYPRYSEQVSFDDSIAATGVLIDTEFGPSYSQLVEKLESRRLEMRGMALVKSGRVPNVDESCGENFTFRSFIECGETWQRLAVNNVPVNPATYNALYDLAVNILDPLIEYFGSIRLTYGFCSAGLGRQITKGIAPRLDQHAGLESTRTGKQICQRGGAACDFIVEHEDMRSVAKWIIANTPFDRLYYYGADRPIHVSYCSAGARVAYEMTPTASGKTMPRRFGT